MSDLGVFNNKGYAEQLTERGMQMGDMGWSKYEADISLSMELEARAELIENAMNRCYPQYGNWKLSEDPYGDTRMVAGATLKMIPQAVFRDYPDVKTILGWIAEHCSLIRA